VLSQENAIVIKEDETRLLILRCVKNDPNAQELLYRKFYSFAMNICLRYFPNRLEARGIINDGFLKILNNLHKFDVEKPFGPWAGRIISNTAIDHYRARSKHMALTDMTDVDVFENATIEHKLYYDELIKLIQKLPPAYRAAFNLHAVDGLTHEEIALKLNISIGGSKSNLFKARKKIRELLAPAYGHSNNIRYK
jgi:RNA polymerase sigma-70 factor (ECF subfamily)